MDWTLLLFVVQSRPKSTNNNNKKTQKRRANQVAKAPSGVVLRNMWNTLGGPDPWPIRKFLIHPYSEIFAISCGTSGIAGTVQEMRLNSLYDPNATGTGHQPYGYDQWAALYGRYKVNACTVDLVFTTPGAANDLCCSAIVQGPGGGLSLTGLSTDRLTELPMVANATLSSAGTRQARIRRRFVLHEIFGVTKQQFDSNVEDYAAAVGASPVRTAVLGFVVSSYSGATDEACSCRCLLTYEVEWFDRVVQGLS